ncbi:hypothetical protein D9613_003364 [Agrocybe pediades]|uniref:F-box domain-containing protein n=1 Tax=Agrocybe pediades TaxID=84607 RepID=A0A8H4QPN7_9AGAR|nr:hypothetical protein D9613_003364 [Agrocybe pediades]
MRRSSRVAAMKSQPAEEIQIPQDDHEMEDFTPDNESEGEDQEENADGSTRKRRGAKRKSASNKAGNPAPTKKFRGMRGRLRDILEMPMDILVEIFGHLKPLDLLHLTWTTKSFRALLLSKNADSRAIWKESIANVPGLPPCPEDLSEPKYTHLAFVNICHKCDRKTSSVEIFWHARVRLCKRCREEEFCVKDPRKIWVALDSSSAKALEDVLTPRQCGYYHKGICIRWYDEYQNAEDKEAWLDSKIATQQKLSAHARQCDGWLQQVEKENRAQKLSVIDERKAIILEHLQKLGWSEEIAMLEAQQESYLRHGVHPLELSVVNKACQRKITEKVLSELEGVLVEHMQSIKKRRLLKERDEVVRKRLPLLQEVHEAYVNSLPANSVYPKVVDIFLNRRVKKIMDLPSETEVTSKDFDPIRSKFPQIASQVMKRLQEQVISMIPSACIPEGCGGHDALKLAVITFYCSKSLCPAGIPYPDLLAHRCATSTDYFTPKTSDFPDHNLPVCHDLVTIGSKLRELPWNAKGLIRFDEDVFKVLTEALKMCGRDPKTTTAEDMDSEKAVFECLDCYDDYEGRLVMSWDGLARHKRRSHPKDMSFCLLKGTDADKARGRMLEDKQRKQSARYYTGMICMHCKEKGNARALEWHALQTHNLSEVTDKDIATCIGHSHEDYNNALAPYRLWPPRPIKLDPLPETTSVPVVDVKMETA